MSQIKGTFEMKQYLALARVSSREQEREGFSLDVQIDGLTRYAKSKEGEIVQMYRIAETATKSEQRKVFRELLTYARDNSDRLDGVLFYKVDRAARNLRDFVELEELESDYGIPFISVTQPTDNTPAGRMQRRVLASMASFYTEQQSVDVREGLARRVENGLFVSRAPYGYRNVRINGRGLIEFSPRDASKVRRIFELYAYEFVPGQDIPDRLVNEGISWTTSKPKFSVSKIYSILNDQSYIGQVRFRGEWHNGTHEPIIDIDTWSRTQVLLGRQCYRSHAMTYAGNLVTCGYCGRPITGETKNKVTQNGEATYIYYRCSRYSLEGHPRIRLREEELDLQIRRFFVFLHSWFQSNVPGWINLVVQAKSAIEKNDLKERAKELKRQHSLTVNKQKQLLSIRLDDEISSEEFAMMKADFGERIQFLREELESIESQQQQPPDMQCSARQVFRKIHKRWKNEDFMFKRPILELLFKGLVLQDKELIPRYRTPLELFRIK